MLGRYMSFTVAAQLTRDLNPSDADEDLSELRAFGRSVKSRTVRVPAMNPHQYAKIFSEELDKFPDIADSFVPPLIDKRDHVPVRAYVR